MWLKKPCCFLTYFILYFAVFSSAQNAKRTLVLHDKENIKETHSRFFRSLTDRGHTLTFKGVDDPSLSLSQYGEPAFDNVILFAPSAEKFGSKQLEVKSLLDFIDAGGNILLSASDKVGDAVQKLAAECGVELDEDDTNLIDHWNYDTKDQGKHTLLVADVKQLVPVNVLVGEKHQAPFLYRGVGLSNDADNPLVVGVLSAAATAYSYDVYADSIENYPSAIGSAAHLITALQARNNARVVVSGSLDFFSDELVSAPVQHAITGARYAQSGNKLLIDALTRWVFQESGVLRFSNVTHRKIASGVSRLVTSDGQETDTCDYTIMDTVEYSIIIEQLVDADPLGRTQKWAPYPEEDVQLQFVRIDPFVRLNMKRDANHRHFLRFKVPDVYGVFKFLVDYNRMGFSHLYSSTQVSVRPLWHTQYERFIPAAYPYYVSAFSMMAGLLLFSLVFLHNRPSNAAAAGKNKSD